jgi:peptidoglycan/xylan/chitin deacetylase (PgdA/CDA1 family)
MKTSHTLGDAKRIKVLRYHRIVEDKDLSAKYRLCLYLWDFRRQLEFLERWGYTTITFNDYRLFLRGELNLPRKPIVLTFDGAYLDNYRIMFPTLQKAGATAVVFAHGDRQIKEDVWNADPNVPRGRMMEENQILELHAAGLEIGSHTMTHPNLASLQPEQASEEITRSRVLLEILLNAPVLSFAYPFGEANARIKHLVAEAGYDIACSYDSGPSKFGVDPLEVRRVIVRNGMSPFLFGVRLLTA